AVVDRLVVRLRLKPPTPTATTSHLLVANDLIGPHGYLRVRRVPVAQGEVGIAVLVEVAHSHRVNPVVGVVRDGRPEGAVAVVEQYGGAGVSVCGDQVGLAVAVEVGDCHGVRVGTRRVAERRAQGAVAVAQQHDDGAAVVRDSEVGPAVAVEVAGRQGGYRPDGRIENGVGGRGLEAATGICEQNADSKTGACPAVGGEVEPAIAVEVAGRQVVGVVSRSGAD